MIMLLYFHLIGFFISFIMLCYIVFKTRGVGIVESLKMFIPSVLIAFIFGWFSVIPVYRQFEEIVKIAMSLKLTREFAKQNGFKRYGRR